MTDNILRNTYIVIEVKIVEGTAAASPAVLCTSMQQALGEMYVKLGYAYQNPCDFTFVSIIDCLGNVIENRVFDNRAERDDVYTFIELQGANNEITVAPITLNTGATAKALAMVAFHNAMSYAWNVGREYTCGIILDTDGYKNKVEIQE